MAHAYTPGLRVSELTVLRKERRLPLQGEVLVDKGEAVKAETPVARTNLPGAVQTINVAGNLGILPEDVPEVMLVKSGDNVKKGEPIAKTKGFFGLFRSTCTSPTEGVIESISKITGQVILREPPVPVEIDAYIDGVVAEILPKEGVIVETEGTFVQGIFGVGGETSGILDLAVNNSKDVLNPDILGGNFSGKIIIGGSLVTSSFIVKAKEVGVRAIVVGGIDDSDLKEFLGYELGVAITGSEKKGITLVITEGFGKMAMADKTFELLKSRVGMKASVNGATQIRAGVMRPEVIVPLDTSKREKNESKTSESGLVIGSSIRVIREPFFGAIGKVTSLPPQLQMLETEAKVRVLEVEFEDGKRAILPRANVEMIEE